VPAGDERHFFVPFEVPDGVAEIEVRHDDLSDANILDWGLEDPQGFRGWGGGNTEPAVVGELAASRSYVPGPIPGGTWRVVVGEAKILEQPARYRIDVVLRDAPTLAPQARAPYEAVAALSSQARWYRGDFHVHSIESGDARPPLDEIADFAKSRGLDFVVITDHNTLTAQDFFVEVQTRHPDLLLVPGMEFTTYWGHATALGATVRVDDKVELAGASIELAVDAFAAQGALFSINHPTLDLGDLCIGCAWKLEIDPARIDGVEIATGGWSQSGQLFAESAIAFWDLVCATGRHVVALGGSDDHRAGVDLGTFDSPIGDPTTLVFADELSVAAIIEGVRRGRTVVKLQGPNDPMLELATSGTRALRATMTGGVGASVRFVRNGVPLEAAAVDSDPFVQELAITPPASGEDRYRAEVLVDDHPRTVTSHVWIAPAPASVTRVEALGGCGCRSSMSSGAPAGWMMALCVALIALRRQLPTPARF
jgi:hypothetical protein